MTIKFCLHALLLLLLVYSCNTGTITKEEQGKYFSKKTYTTKPLPTYEANREQLPEPILDGNPDWINMYWKCWQTVFTKLRQPMAGSPFVSNYIDEGFNTKIFQWDTHCMIMFGKYAHHVFPFIESHDNFYRCQHADGHICREISEEDGTDFIFGDISHTANPPLYSWIETEYYKFTRDTARLSMVLPAIEKLAEWLETGRKQTHTRHGLYWQTGLGSGMDNLPRYGAGWIDMSCQIKTLNSSIADICAILGETEKEKKYSSKADSISKRINQWMWSEKDGIYYDITFHGNQVQTKTAAAFWPLFSGVASEDQAAKLVTHLKDTATFYRHMPFASLAATEKEFEPYGNYWQGGIWTPLNYMILKGLENYGYDNFAHEAAEKYLTAMAADFETTSTFWEFYSPDKGYKPYREDGIKRTPVDQPYKFWAERDFVGWTGMAPITILFENIIGINPDGAKSEITWNIIRTDRHGINNLHFGGITASLECAARNDINQPASIIITSDHPFTLIVKKEGLKKSFSINKGKNSLSF